MIDWSAVSAVTDLYQTAKEIFCSISFRKQEVRTTPPIPILEQQIERYQEILGKRHKHLRENILHLNSRQMSDFYGFEKVSYLEDCEAGLDEFPTESIKRLVQVFFVRPEYLQEGITPIFQSFDIISTRDDCRRLLEQEFKPYFLCSPTFEENGYVYLVFWKQDEGYWRMIQSNTVGSFYSSGGGAQNIFNLIYSMLDLNLSPDWMNISFLNVDSSEWKELSKGCWYNKGMSRYLGAANHQAREIFESWFNNAQERRKSSSISFIATGTTSDNTITSHPSEEKKQRERTDLIHRMRGLLKTNKSAPTDAEVQTMLEERLVEKYS